MTWPGILVFAAHLLALPMALIRPRLVILAMVATAALRAEKLGPSVISTNQLEGLALALAVVRLWNRADPLWLGRLDIAILIIYALTLFVLILQAFSSDVGAYRLGQFAYRDAFRPVIYFLGAHIYLRSGGRPQTLLYAACVPVAVMIVAVFLEWQYFWSWRTFFGSEFAIIGVDKWEFVSRFRYRLINGPFGHWVGTGTFLTLYLTFALVPLGAEAPRRTLCRLALGAAGLASVMIIGGRAAMLGAALASATALGLFILSPSRPLVSIPSWGPVAAASLAFVASGRVRGFDSTTCT